MGQQRHFSAFQQCLEFLACRSIGSPAVQESLKSLTSLPEHRSEGVQ